MQAEVQQLKQSNTALSQQLALSKVAGPPLPHPRSPLKQVPIPSQAPALKGTSIPSESLRVKLHGQDSKLQAEDRVPAEEGSQNKLPQASLQHLKEPAVHHQLCASTTMFTQLHEV